MEMKGAQTYREQNISMMSSEELLMLLFDELVMRLHRGKLALDKKNMELFEASIDRSLEIIRYLDVTLDHSYPLSNDLHRLYDFFCYELSRVKIGRNAKELDEVSPMIVDLRDTFRTAARQVAEGKGN